MNWNRDGLTILCQDVVAAVYAVRRPTGRFELRDDFFACH